MSTPTRTHRRRSRDEWQQLITEQQRSELSQQAFCEQKGLALTSFRNWKRRLADKAPARQTRHADWLALPLDLTQVVNAHWNIELDLGNGLCLRLRQR